MPVRKLSSHVVGYLGERLVEVYAILSSRGRLTSFGPGVDVDHKDLIFDERGRNRNVYAQVKTRLAVSPSGLFQFRAEYPSGPAPASARFVYVLCHLDSTRMALMHVWLVPSVDFNRLAFRVRSRAGTVLEADPGPGTRGRWSRYRITPDQLGPRLLEIVQKAPAEKPLTLPPSLLFVRQ